MYAKLLVMLWFLVVATIVAYLAIQRIWHPFWYGRPGPHWNHWICRCMGLTDDYIIRLQPADFPPESRWDKPQPCVKKRLPEYVALLNENYAISQDYVHTYTESVLETLLFAPGVLAFEVIEGEECVGLIASLPLKSTVAGQLAHLLAKSPSHTTIGLIDFLCVAAPVRGMRLAEHLIAWIDTYASQIGRRVHVFEREGRPAPIPTVGTTVYSWLSVDKVGPQSSQGVEQAIATAVAGQDLVNENDVSRWLDPEQTTTLVFYDTELGTIIVEDAHMATCSGKTSQFGIVLVFIPQPGKETELFNKAARWQYILAPDHVVKQLPDKLWQHSSVAFTHLYNCVTSAANLRILTA